MAAQPQHTLATANAPSTTHGPLLSASPSSTRAASPRLAHYSSGRLSSPSSVIGVGGSSGCGSGGGDRCGIGRGICGSTRSLISNTSSTSTTQHNHYQTPRPASRRVRPCSLCGTTALRPHPTFLNSSPVGPLEQPIVLLHRLEDGLPQGDVKSLHAFGTIRLLPVRPPEDHDASDYEGDSDTSDGGKGDRVKQAMDHVTDPHTAKENKREKNSLWGGDSGSYDDSEDSGDRFCGKNQEVEMKSILFEDECSLEDIVESEVSVNPINGNHGCVEIFRPSVIKHSLSNSSDNDSERESFSDVLIGEVVLENEQSDSDSDRDVVINNAINQSQNKVSKCQDSNSETDKIDKAQNSEKEATALPPCSSPVSHTNHLTDYTLGSPTNPTSLSSVITPSSATATVSEASLSSSCPSTHSTCTQSSIISQPLVSLSHDRRDSNTKAKCHRSSPSLLDHSVVYSPTARHSPMSLSPSTASSHLPVPSPPFSIPSPSLVTSPPSSPPSPCESSSLLFSPPPSPSPDITDLDTTRLEEKEDLQTQPSSPYSPGTSPASPASLLSQSDSPPSPCVCAESPQNSPDPMDPTVDDQTDSNKIDSNLDVVSHPLLHPAVAPQHPLTPSHDNQVDSSIKTQVECSLDINDTSAPTQVELKGSSECSDPLRHGDSMAYDDSEKKTKPSLDNCASSIVEQVNVEPDTTPMKIRFRIRPKTNKPFVQKLKKEEHSNNGIPKIVLTLKGDGPNKEYSCSNRIRNEDQSFSDVNMGFRKHKSKKEKKEKEKYRVKKSLKGNRYKRHLELFGEDSNDSLELRRNNIEGLNGKGEDILRVPDVIQDCAKSPLAFPKLDLEPVLDPEDVGKPGSITNLLVVKKERDDSEVRPPKETRVKKRVKLQKKKPTRGMLAKKKILRSLNQKKVLPVRRRPRRMGLGLIKEDPTSPKSESACKVEENVDFNDEVSNCDSTAEFEKTIKNLEQKLDTEREIKEENSADLTSSSSNTECAEKNTPEKSDSVSSQDSSTVVGEDVIVKTEKQATSKTTGSYLRTRRDRNCKIPESVTDSSKCVWVSFGVDAPVPLPTSDVPSLRADTKVREKSMKSRKNTEESPPRRESAKRNDESKTYTNTSSQNTDNKRSSSSKGSSAASKKNEDAEAVETKMNSVDHLIEENAKQLIKDFKGKKTKISENVIILPNKEAENWKPIKPHSKNKVHEEQAERGPVEGLTENANRSLNSSPKRSSVSVDERLHDRRSSFEATEEKTKLKNCVNIAAERAEPSGEVSATKARMDSSRDSSLTDECTKISAADLIRDDQYYRPKKIQKVLNENILNAAKYPKTGCASIPNTPPSSNSSIDERESDSNQFNSDPMQKATEELGNESAKSRAESDASESINNEKINEPNREQDSEVRNTDVEGPPSKPPHDPEFEKVWGVRFRRRGRRKKQTGKLSSQSKSPASPSGKQQESQAQNESASNAQASQPARENVEGKKDKEMRKTIRRTRKRDENGSDSESSSHSEGSGKSSAYKKVQQCIEVQHEEERGRRLAQEIKGFNWLEQKIKNNSLNPPTSSASTAPVSKKLPVLLPKTLTRTLSLPATSLATTSLIQSNSQPLACKRDESDFRRNSYTGGVPSCGLRGHLQTAVPPLLPSSRVTALPKRRSSPPSLLQSPTAGGAVTTAIAAPSSSPGPLHGSININPTMGVVYGPVQSSGPATYSIADDSRATLYSTTECDSATLYSSTDSNKATLYGVPNPQLEVLFEDAQATAGILYSDAINAQVTTTSSIPHPIQHLSSGMSSHPFSLTTSTRHEDLNKGNNEIVVSNSTSSPQVSSGLSASCGANSAAVVSLNDADDKSSAAVMADIVKTNMTVSTTATDVIATSSVSLNTEGSNSVQQPQVPGGPAIGVRFSHKQALLKRAFSDMLKSESNTLPVSTPEVKNFADKDTKVQDAPSQDDCALIIDVDAKSRNAGSTDIEETPCPNSESSKSSDDKGLSDCASQNVKSEILDTGNVKSSNTESKSSAKENKIQDLEFTENIKSAASPDTIKEKLLKCMSLKNEEKPCVNNKDKDEVAGVDSAQLFSMLYEELKRTREELERLRKRQELLLPEKCEKKDEEEKEENPVITKEKSESPKTQSISKHEDQSGNSAEKTGRISIRSDLIASESEVATVSHVSPLNAASSVTTLADCTANAKPPVPTEKPLLSPLPKTSPSIPQTSPASCRASPRSARASPSSQTNPVLNSLLGSPAAAQPDVSIIHTSLGPPLASPTASQKCTVSSPYSVSVVTSHGIHPPRTSPVLLRSSPVIARNSPGISGSPGIPKTSPGLKCTSPAAQSPGVPKDTNLVEMMPSKLRTAFGLNREVEVMAVSVASRPPLTEPPPQTFLQVVGDKHGVQDTHLLLDVVRSRTQDLINSNDKERNPLQNSVSLSQRSPHEAVKRSLPPLSAETDVKRTRMSTSDLPEFPPSSRKPPPPLKPVASVQRRYSDGTDSRKVEPIMVHLPHTNLHALSSPPNEPNSAASLYTYSHLRSSPSHHLSGRRSNESSVDRNIEYQHTQYQHHIGSSPPIMRSLGPDKATIIPIPAPPKPSVIHPYVKPFVPPVSRGSAMDQHQTARHEQPSSAQDYPRASVAYFQKMKQTAQQNYDHALSAAERGVGVGKEGLQAPSGPFEKTIQPQTFAPRVLVRESVPENSLQMRPPPPFSNAHFPECGPCVPNIVPSHHFLNNLHHNANPSIHHMVTSGLLLSGLQGSSTTLTTSKSSPRNVSASSSEKKQCLSCPQQARFLCSGCKKAWYCSENCQRNHWAVHNTSCVP